MKKIKNIIFLYWSICACLSLFVTFFASLLIAKNFKELTLTMAGSFCLGLAIILAFYIFEKKFLNKIAKITEDVESINYQLSNIIIKKYGETNLIELKFTRLGTEFYLKIRTLKNIGIYQNISIENINLKKNKFYSLTFFVKKYENQYDSHYFYQEPVSIDYMNLSHFEDYSFKNSKKFKPTLYLVK